MIFIESIIYKHACPYCGATVDSGLITAERIHYVELEEEGSHVVATKTSVASEVNKLYYCDRCENIFVRFIIVEEEAN